MTETANRLLATFETLSPNEQHELLAQMMRRAQALPHAAMSDEELTAVADDLFQLLDTEEARGDHS